MPFLPESSAMLTVRYLYDLNFVTDCTEIPNTALDSRLDYMATVKSNLCFSSDTEFQS